ncbi:HMG box protein [Apiospora arundinis]
MTFISTSSVATTTSEGAHVTPTPGSAGVIAPGPTQNGIIPSCSKYAKRKEGDSCAAFADRSDIAPPTCTRRTAYLERMGRAATPISGQTSGTSSDSDKNICHPSWVNADWDPE